MEKTVEILNRHKTPPAFKAAAFSGDGDKWVTEIDRDMAVSYRIKDRIFKKQSQYQGIEIFESQSHGKIMTLDGIVMLTERRNSRTTKCLRTSLCPRIRVRKTCL